MVVAQAQGQHQARVEAAAVPHRLHGTAADAQYGYFRCIDDRGKGSATYAAQAADSKARATHLAGGEFAFTPFLRELGQLLADLHNAFLVCIFEHGHNQPVRGVGSKANVPVLFVNEAVTIE